MNWYTAALARAPVPTLIGTGVAVVGGYFLLRKLFSREKQPIPRYNLPAGGSGIPIVGHSPQGKPILWSPDPLATELYDSMKGVGFGTNRKDEAWRQLSELASNDMVVAVYNAFNSIPGAADGGSLKQWIKDETGEWWGGHQEAAIQRLDAAGLP